MKRLLMVAFHVPPLVGASGIQRTLRFAQYLPEFGWEPLILAPHPRVYDPASCDRQQELPCRLDIYPAFAVDAARHLSLMGRYPLSLALPDRWISWRWDAVRVGKGLIRRFRPAALWSTYPIATAHRIGATLQNMAGLPWIADFRDPMAQDDYPSHPRVWQAFKQVEEQTVRQASRCVFTAPSAVHIYRSRYPGVSEKNIVLIENGYEETSFSGLDPQAIDQGSLVPGKQVVLHSGLVYPSERDPRALFAALRQLRHDGRLTAEHFLLRLRASGHDDWLAKQVREYALGEMVELVPPLPYRDALAEMLRADGLLIMQAANCNAQIPAKIYEYHRSGRLLLGLTDPNGDTAWKLRQFGCRHLAPLDDQEAIAQTVLRFLQDAACQAVPKAPAGFAGVGESRRRRTQELAAQLDKIIAPGEKGY
jgi:hypothetical protein